jgi:multisubunit Na+/H+ antiporter MnhG subunit
MNDDGYSDNGRRKHAPSRGVTFGMICLLVATVFFLLSYISAFNSILLGMGTLMLFGGVSMILDTIEHS